MATAANSAIEVLAEKVRVLEEGVKELKADMRLVMNEVDDIDTSKELMLQKIQGIENIIGETKTAINKIEVAVTKDTGWRGFAIDVLKAVAQIAALVGAGKFIF